MIERLLGQMFKLLMVIAVVSVLLGFVIGAAVAATSITHVVPTIIADVLATLATGVFFGLGVRIHHALTGRGGHAGRERDAHERQERLTVRRAAEEVPAVMLPELPEDSDPAISMEDD